MIHTLFNQEVTLDKVEHKYYNKGGEQYLSFTRFFEYLSPKFDSHTISSHVARSEGTTGEEVRAKWAKTATDGTELDVALKHYSQTGQIQSVHAHLAEVVKEVSKKYKDYHRCYEDVVVFSNKYRVAGEIDKLSLLSNRRNCSFHISDFKRFEKGMSYEPKGQKWLNYPFNHLVNSKFTKIAFQMSFYAYLFEQLTEHRCEQLFIDVIIPDGDKYRNEVVQVNYLKMEVEYALEHFSSRILHDLEPKEDIVDEF